MAISISALKEKSGSGKSSGGMSISSLYQKRGIDYESILNVGRQKNQQYEEKKRQERLLKQQQAIEEFNAKREKVANGNIVRRIWDLQKNIRGKADTLPEIEGASNMYNAQRQAQVAQNEANSYWKGNLVRSAVDKGAEKFKEDKAARERFGKGGVQKTLGSLATDIDYGIGAAKNL
jgi:hypothetical protein